MILNRQGKEELYVHNSYNANYGSCIIRHLEENDTIAVTLSSEFSESYVFGSPTEIYSTFSCAKLFDAEAEKSKNNTNNC